MSLLDDIQNLSKYLKKCMFLKHGNSKSKVSITKREAQRKQNKWIFVWNLYEDLTKAIKRLIMRMTIFVFHNPFYISIWRDFR